LFEQELELHYVLDNPAPRMLQIRAREARTRLALAKNNPEMIKLNRRLHREFKAVTRDAQAKEEAAAAAGKATGEAPPASEFGYPPSRLGMARALDREADYRLYYEVASWLSHPGVITSDLHFLVDSYGLIALRPEGPADPEMTVQGLALAFGSLANLIERANYSLGPVAGVGGALAELVARIEATGVPPDGHYSPQRRRRDGASR
jgi:hypothetical protein